MLFYLLDPEALKEMQESQRAMQEGGLAKTLNSLLQPQQAQQ
jgi:hypothetical protein